MALFEQDGKINKRIHFIGVAGIGMSGLAMLVAKKGAEVSGSDIASCGEVVDNLKSCIRFFSGHNKNNIVDNLDLVIVSSAIDRHNCELQESNRKGIVVIPRAKLLSMVMQNQVGIAVTGTHGKTTTTSILGNILTFSKLDPTVVVGGKVINNNNLQVRVGGGDLFVAEADESDSSFLYLNPFLAVVTSFDADHMENFNQDKLTLGQAFLDFIHRLPEDGVAVISSDDENLLSILGQIKRRCISYGFNEKSDYRVSGYVLRGNKFYFDLHLPNSEIESYCTMQPGKHNVLNAVAAIVAAKQLGVSYDLIKNSLLDFAGVGRRFEHIGDLDLFGKVVKFIDDYGHHPRAVRCVVNTVRELWPSKRLVICFEPHRYSRLAYLFNDFVTELSKADLVFLLPVYNCKEKMIDNFDSSLLEQKILNKAILVDQVDLSELLLKNLLDNDVVVAMGAGNISNNIRSAYVKLSKIVSETSFE
jgi:UDP-N-acetylmuramate--alanine ligase